MERANRNKCLDADTFNELKRLGEGDRRFLSGIIDLFLQHTPPVLSDLKTAVENKDAEAVEHLAHRLKGFCGNIGAWEMTEISAALERQAKLSLSGADQLVGRLYENFESVKLALATEYNQES